MQQRYALRVHRGDFHAEYEFNATPAGIQQLKDSIKPEFSYDILLNDGIIYRHDAGAPMTTDGTGLDKG